MVAPLSGPESHRTLIDDLLAEQGRLTAVERFSQRHDRCQLPAPGRNYRDLIPREKPGVGQQYAFGVDLDACTGCKACVSACHSLNGLDEDEIWRNVGMIHGGLLERPYQQTVTAACHHCVDPACLEGCPVLAYEKDAETGIVRHLDDQCIGCQYCILKCPYDVPKYSRKKGIVRKCDMCTNRLSVGEAPACVAACPTQAIRIELVDKQEVSRAARADSTVIAGAFPSDYTKPTTSYRTRRTMPADVRPADGLRLRLEHAHWPLIGMLVLTQASAGLFAAAALAPTGVRALATAGFLVLQAGLAVSVLHLGRPLGAWRFFLGLRKSWMSREILAFSVFAGAAGACATVAWWDVIVGFMPLVRIVENVVRPAEWAVPLVWVTTLLGAVGIYCSAMIYIDTRRAFWTPELTFPKFFGAAVVLGAACAACVLGWTQDAALGLPPAAQAAAIVALLTHAALAGWEFSHLSAALRNPDDAIHGSALNIWSLARPLVFGRAGFFLVATACTLVAFAGTGRGSAIWMTLALLATAVSLVIERYFYFTAVVAPKMPGGVAV